MDNAGTKPVSNGYRLRYRGSLAFACSLFIVTLLSFSTDTFAQPDPEGGPPPPLKLISKDERTRLEAEVNVKSRTVVAIDLMNLRVSAAEKRAAAEDFDAMYTELGAFQGLLDNTLEFLIRSDNDSDKVLNNFKRFEIGLRAFVPRIETVRRELPSSYEPYVKGLIRYIRDARGRALEPLFGDSVVRQPQRPTP